MVGTGDAFRVITFNCAAGNPRILTPQAAFLDLPFYRAILDGAQITLILALQEVGPGQLAALKAARSDAFSLLHIARPGQGNALLIPSRFKVLGSRARFYRWRWPEAYGEESVAWRQYFELRMWIEAWLLDTVTDRMFTVFTTHLSGNGPVRVPQADQLFTRIRRARLDGPVILAGDLNTRPGGKSAANVHVMGLIGELRDMAPTAVDPRRPIIDWVLADGFESVACGLWTDDDIALPGFPTAELISDHWAKEATVRYA